MVGRRFARLVVLGIADRAASRELRWRARCDCGNEVIVRGSRLRSGITKSCGCFRRDRAGTLNVVHGASNTWLYREWQRIIDRCTNPKHVSFVNYGGRGIRVCDRWRASFETFAADVPVPTDTEHSIERIDNTRGYEPGNVRWATDQEQARNKRTNRILTAFGRSQCVAAWADETGIASRTIRARLARGWAIEDALSRPAA